MIPFTEHNSHDKQTENASHRFGDEFSPRVTITSALPYVNGVKHLGNIAGSLLPADVFHRFLDLLNVDNIFICGTDEHGTAIEIAAEEEGLSCADFVRKYHKIQKEIYYLWNFDFTYFGQTSSPTNHYMTQQLFRAAYKNGYVLHRTLVVPFCENDLRFLPDRYVMGTCPVCGSGSARGDQCEACATVLDPSDLKEPRCIICGKGDISFRSEKHLFLDYGMLSPKIESWIQGNKHWHHNTRTLALGWIKQGLKPRGITRNLQWGVKVPLEGFEHLVFYVWFDAPIGYVAMTKDAFDKSVIKKWKEYWTDSKIYHFLGKDNIPFHTIFWPGTLLAARDAEIYHDRTSFALPHRVVGYEYLNWGGQKFSTSKGIGLFSDEALELFPVDCWRFYLSCLLPEGKDSNFDWNDFQKRINGELIANYGNLFYRVTYFIKEHFDGQLPKGIIDDEGLAFFQLLKDRQGKIEEYVKNVNLKEALKQVMLLSSEANKYFQDKKPWENREGYKTANTLYTAANMLVPLSLLLRPYIPATAEMALQALGVDRHIEWDELAQPRLRHGHKIEAKILFKKISDEEIERARNYKSRYVKKSESVAERITEKDIDKVKAKPMIKFEDFNKVDMAVGTIRDARDHPGADKLYVLQVDMGNEIRQLVAGLKGIYEKEDLIGRQVIVVANLEAKELRGMKSHGMLLAAGDGTLISPAKRVENGSRLR